MIFAYSVSGNLPKGGVLEDIPNLLAMPAMMLLVLPGAVSFTVLWQRWPRLETELLRPQRREDYVDYLHRGVAEILLQFDIALVAWFSCYYLLFLRTSMSLHDFLILLALAVSVQVFALSLGLLLVAIHRGVVTIAGYGAVCWVVTFGVIVPWFELRDSVGGGPFLAVSAVLLVISFLLWRAARRRWLNAEFG